MNAEIFADTIVGMPQSASLCANSRVCYYNDVKSYYAQLRETLLHYNSLPYIVNVKEVFIECISRYEYLSTLGTNREVYEKMYDLISESM